jgi:DNA invertase Pin-like site-specific DNA recombinase
MGRLTLNVLLSFAQFEREVTSERIRQIAASSARVSGSAWHRSGMTATGITVNEPEAETVRAIFRSYLKLGSLNLLMTDPAQGTSPRARSRPGRP